MKHANPNTTRSTRVDQGARFRWTSNAILWFGGTCIGLGAMGAWFDLVAKI